MDWSWKVKLPVSPLNDGFPITGWWTWATSDQPTYLIDVPRVGRFLFGRSSVHFVQTSKRIINLPDAARK